ncbi:MAG: DUF3696 domain-containing protein [Magnetococcus sp. YQC-5]
MLTHIHLTSFKCYDSLSLPLAPLTLLTGFNAGGKSTALQGLLLPAQGLPPRGNHRGGAISLNGPLVRLGTAGEILHSGSREMSVSMENHDSRIKWTLKPRSQHGSIMDITQVNIQENGTTYNYDQNDPLDALMPVAHSHPLTQAMMQAISETVFLGALRYGTKDLFPSPDEAMIIHADVGVQGEFAPWWFLQSSDDPVDSERCHPKEQKASQLRRQFNTWAGELFPGAQANTVPVPRTSAIRLELRIGEHGEWRRPANIGYGLTYAFPIIVAGLLAKKGQILVIDSPEAHLHPMGQSRMGYFLASMAAAGVHILLETHSDHVLNGVRIAVKNRTINAHDVALHFFQQSQTPLTSAAPVVSPSVDNQGNLSDWPIGFFDQTEKDLAHIAGWE